MTKIITFKKRKDFLRVAKGEYIATGNIVLQATQSLYASNNIFVGFTATKKIGNAVTRNRAKRRMRAIARELLVQNGLPIYDYVLVARMSTPVCDFKTLKKDTNYAIRKIHQKFIDKLNIDSKENDKENS